MPSDHSDFEATLGRIRPAALDDELLERLVSCTEDSWKEPTPEERAFESRLRETSPTALPAELMASLEHIVSDTPFPNPQKVVCFPKNKPRRQPKDSFWWSRVAGVALLGAAAALYLPATFHNKQETAARTPAPGESTAPQADVSSLVPAGFRRGLQDAADGGIVWKNNKPFRVLKITYLEEGTLKSGDGKTYQAKRPRVEYILVPAKTN